CCGTNPSYISKLRDTIDNKPEPGDKIKRYEHETYNEKNIIKNTFKEKVKNGDFVIAVELSAPVDTDINKIMTGAKVCKDNNIDIVTVPD
ncbi:hypothetical protein ACJBSC_11185, partial [Streptococcus suis]